MRLAVFRKGFGWGSAEKASGIRNGAHSSGADALGMFQEIMVLSLFSRSRNSFLQDFP
jgi:hypothetical protein